MNATPCLALHCTLSFLPSIRIDPMLQALLSIHLSESLQATRLYDQLNSEPCSAAAYRVSPSGPVQLKPPRTAPGTICSVTCKDALSHIPRIPLMYTGFIVPSFPCYSHDLRASSPILSLSSPYALQYKQANLAHHLPGTKENKG